MRHANPATRDRIIRWDRNRPRSKRKLENASHVKKNGGRKTAVGNGVRSIQRNTLKELKVDALESKLPQRNPTWRRCLAKRLRDSLKRKPREQGWHLSLKRLAGKAPVPASVFFVFRSYSSEHLSTKTTPSYGRWLVGKTRALHHMGDGFVTASRSSA